MDLKRACTCKKFTIVDNNEEQNSIYAGNSKEAALLWAKKRCNIGGERALLEEEQAIIVLGDGITESYAISAAVSIDYSVRKIK